MSADVVTTEKVICPQTHTQAVPDNKEQIEQAFLLFLASVGIKQTESIHTQIKQIVTNPAEYKVENYPETKTETKTEISEVPSEEKSEVVFDQDSFINETRTVFSSDVLPIDTLHRSFDKYFDEKKFSEYVLNSKLVKESKQLTAMNGQFVGQFYRLKGKYQGKIEEVNLVVNFQIDERKKQIDGDFQMTLIRDDQEYSRSRGMGNNNDIYINPSDSGTVIIRAAPNMYFHFNDLKLRQANVYDENKFVGISILNRLD